MANYLVAVDNSGFSKAAFWTAVYMIKGKKDARLFILNVIENTRENSPFFFVPSTIQQVIQEESKKNSRALLKYYGSLAKASDIDYTCIMAISNHAPEMICQQVIGKKIDFLLIGRRGMGLLKRLVMGSISRYCVENAECNVIVVKNEWGPPEIHANKSKVIAAEEKERQRRIKEEENFEKKEKFHSELDLNIARLAEETERMARIHEEDECKAREKEDREAAHIGAVIDEEEERKRRIKQDAIIDDRVHRVEILEHAFSPSD